CMINNKPYFVGLLQTDHHPIGRSTAALVKLDGATGDILLKKLFLGRYQFKSSTIEIERHSDNNTVVLKQIGRKLEVVMYDSMRTVLWRKTLTKDYYLFSKLIYISPLNNDIFIPAYSSHEEPSGIYTDSIHLFRLDDQGLLLNEHTFSVKNYLSYPVEFYEDSNSSMLFYSKGNTLRYRKITSSSVSAEYDTKVKYYPVSTQTKYCINKNDSILLLFGKGSSASGMFKLNKNTHALTSVSGYGAINYALELDTHHVVLCGNSDVGYETISVYNHEQKKVVWFKNISSSGNIYKCVTDPSKNFIYSIGNFKTYIPSNIIIRKYNIQNGAISWEYIYNGAANLDDYPLDIAYDSLRNEIIVTGYETYNYEKRVLILVLDTSGKRMNRIIRGGDFAGDNTGNCVRVFSDGTRWVGGNLNKNPHGLAGFIFEVGPCSTKYSTISPVTCGGYITPSGKYINKSGIYSDTVSTIQGCDSVITINLVIKTTSKNTIAVSSCRAYISPSGKYTWTVNGKFYDTISTIYGCDSILTVNLTIKTFVQSTINVGACKSYTSPSGKYIWMASGKYYDTVFSASNCDSIFTINLTISTYQTITKSDTACNNYHSPSGKYMWTASGIYQDTIFSTGCDSIFTIHLTVNKSSSDSINPISCTNYTSPSGRFTWTSSGVYIDTIQTTSGCDSIITVNLTVGLVNTGVAVNNNILTANATNAQYQWMDCNTNSILSGDTNQQFIPSINGNYAVIVKENSCTDTSACYLITNVNTNEVYTGDRMRVFPNPSDGIYNLKSLAPLDGSLLKVYDILGKIVLEKDNLTGNELELDLSKINAGIYTLTITSNNTVYTVKIIKK
ncbi:MAG TPA: T9SS type A sorting domain-containing protein, partial [Bacteroidia bacterium]|nr:T9SS type A sorting domain-containing protein [Bacteroidia bacterium]